MLLIGVDLGGTNIKAGLVDDTGQLIEKLSVPTEAHLGKDRVIENVCAAAREAAGGTKWKNIGAVGVGSPGPLNHRTGIVITTPNLGWENVPLADEVASRLGVKVFLENDANAACWGEYWVGAGKGCGSMVLLTLGTGIGSGIILDGCLWRGSTGAGAEMGHMVIDCDGEECVCGNRGCLEVYASAPATVRRFLRMKGDVSSDVTADMIHKEALAGNVTARQALEETGRYLGIAVANIANVLNPEIVLFSGGLAGAADILIPVIREEVLHRAFDVVTVNLAIATGAIPDDAGVIGAAGCAMERL